MRLIDADYLKNLPFERMIHTDFGETAIPIEEIDNAQTVEARPQGEWEEGTQGYYCSKCDYYDQSYFEHNFCPNCGADMRGGNE